MGLNEILVLDDDPLTKSSLEYVLASEFVVRAFTSPEDAERYLAGNRPDAALLDLNFPKHNGLTLLEAWTAKFPELPVISCSAEIKIERAMECLRLGAADYLVKPFQRDDLLRVVRRTVEKRRLREQSGGSDGPLPLKTSALPSAFIGESRPARDILEKVRLLRGQSHLNVLILGESGTGKEVIARLLHTQEADPKRPFVAVNMPAVPLSLVEAEFFGVERGAYTDAKTARPGKFELADGGDLFLDEIGDLSLETQAKILRVLQEKYVERVGAVKGRAVTFRAICATNRSLADLVAGGKFREDLMYRLSDMVLWLPALRERREDIPLLVAHFLKKYQPRRRVKLSAAALDKLVAYDWPGNVRQLESTLKRALIFGTGDVLEDVEIFDPASLNPRRATPAPVSETASFEGQIERFERLVIQDSLRRHRGDRNATIRELKLSKATFYRKVSQLKISLDSAYDTLN